MTFGYARDSKYAFAIPGAILAYVLEVLGVIILGLVIWKLAPRFATNTNQAMATTLAAYVHTPVFLISVFYAVPELDLQVLLGLP